VCGERRWTAECARVPIQEALYAHKHWFTAALCATAPALAPTALPSSFVQLCAVEAESPVGAIHVSGVKSDNMAPAPTLLLEWRLSVPAGLQVTYSPLNVLRQTWGHISKVMGLQPGEFTRIP
jgi:hypothetical protein